MTDETEARAAEITQPILIDLGSQKRAKIKNLKKGKGKLWDDVKNVVNETREMLGAEADGKILVPIVLIYSKKSRRNRLEKILKPYWK